MTCVNRFLTILLSVLIITSTFGAVSAQTESPEVITFIVSDNPVDLVPVQKIAEILKGEGYTVNILVTKWGEVDQSVIDNLTETYTDIVVIVGGSKAVDKYYEEVLEELGIPYIRLNGSDRYLSLIHI